MEEGWRAWRDGFARTLPIASLENARLARNRARRHHQRRRRVRPLPHQIGRGLVRPGEFRNGRAVITEDLAPLLGRALARGNRKDTPHVRRQRVGLGLGRGGERDAEPPDVRRFKTLRRAAAELFLLERKLQQRAAVVTGDWRLR